MGLLRRRSKVTFTRAQALNSRPIRNGVVMWEKNEAGEIEISVPRSQTRLARIIGSIFPAPDQRAMVLDEIGTYIWELCDGTLTVEGLVSKLRERYKLNRRETEASVTQYLKTLAERGLIGFQIEGGQP